ncbi:MAG: hypothetical protein FWF73_00220, partial [Spirochaetes bacterium]|nr:hypothetical protein [Spirochaetota bacterium]
MIPPASSSSLPQALNISKAQVNKTKIGFDKFTSILEKSENSLGAWSLELGAWSLELGAWSLELGAWSLELG